MQKIAVFCPNWVGDAIMATPAFRALRQHFANSKLVAVLKPYVARVLEGAPWFDEQIYLSGNRPWSERWPAVAVRLRRERIDLAILFANTFRTGLVAWLGGCKQRIGYACHGRGIFLSKRLRHPRDAHGKRVVSPEIDAYNCLAEAAGCPRPSYRMELFTSASDETAADDVWRKSNFHRYSEVVCLNPGGAFGSSKHWPTEHFATLARHLVERRGCAVLVLCGPAERDIARQIVQQASRPAVHSLADEKLSLGLTKACIRRSDLLITTDSGPRHIAAAFNRPVVTLFGPTHIAWTETYYAQAIHLQKKVECGPCQLRVCPLDHRCMKGLLPADVLAATERLLRRAG